MSGIVGVVRRDGAPADPAVLQTLTAALAFRGPDGRATWHDGPAGLGHALLHTTPEAEHQPYSADGRLWLVADLRLDDRAALRERLAGLGHTLPADAPDVALLWHALAAWADGCVEHLLGDFAFAAWDAPRRRLFCARDHFGIKPFFYAETAPALVFGNTLDVVRQHPGVPDELNDRAVADFLLFGYNREADTTVYAVVRRLPAAHTLTWDGHGLRVARYWRLPPDGDLWLPREQEYVERLRELLRVAVRDRLRTDRAAVMMSGGLDSPLVAAVAREVGGPGLDLHANTLVHSAGGPEGHYAGLAARHLGLPIHVLDGSGLRLADLLERPGHVRPEPVREVMLAAVQHDLLRAVAGRAAVVLTGFGGDPALKGSSGYAGALLREGAWGRLAAGLWASLRRGRIPHAGLRASLGRRREKGRPPPPLPDWIAGDLVQRLDLGCRWQAAHEHRHDSAHARRPEGWRNLAGPFWPHHFGTYDPGATGVPVEVRHPLFDVRVVSYLLAVPAWPWCDNKRLLREAAAGLLPDALLRRPKSVLGAGPLGEPFAAGGDWLDRLPPVPGLDRYVDRGRVPPLRDLPDGGALTAHLAVSGLYCWLRTRGKSRS